MGRQWTHDTGIIYTDNPFILTIMSKNMGQSDAVVADFCHDFEDYARTLDAALPAYLQAQQQTAEEEARSLAEEEEQIPDPQKIVEQLVAVTKKVRPEKKKRKN